VMMMVVVVVVVALEKQLKDVSSLRPRWQPPLRQQQESLGGTTAPCIKVTVRVKRQQSAQ
jgi:hypothetical protein